MKSVGYVFDLGQPVGLRAGKQTDWHGTSAILADTMALACVWKGKAVALQWQFFGSLKSNDLTNRQTI
jgi:4'-phosphopantetheinyl transferase superfamily domain protein